MLKKKLGIEAVERDWQLLLDYYKIPTTLNITEGCERELEWVSLGTARC